MRTKTLLLLAAVGAAGVVTSMAQVYSVNAVGYVNKAIPANSFALISNPLNAATNKIGALFQPVPAGFQVFAYVGGVYKVATFDDLEGAYLPADVAALEVKPGGGVFVKNPTAQPVTITFVGEVPQGTLTTPLVAGLQIVSSQVPQAGTAKDLGLVGAAGDQIFQWNVATQKYAASTFDDLENNWIPALTPLDVGDAFFLKKVAAGSWTRTFNVNG